MSKAKDHLKFKNHLSNSTQSTSVVDSLLDSPITHIQQSVKKHIGDNDSDVDFDTDDSYTHTGSIEIHSSDELNTDPESDDKHQEIGDEIYKTSNNKPKEIKTQTNTKDLPPLSPPIDPNKPKLKSVHSRKNAFIVDMSFNLFDEASMAVNFDNDKMLNRIRTQSTLIHKNKQEKKEAELIAVKEEIISTEETYVKGLKTLNDEFMEYFFTAKLIKKKHKARLTTSLKSILTLHQDILSDFHKGGVNGVLDVLVKKGSFFNLYEDYVTNYDNMLDFFSKKEQKNKKLKQYLKQKRKEKKGFANFLIMPIQRIPRYLLLLNEIKKNTSKEENKSQYQKVKAALYTIDKLAHQINNKQKEVENMSACFHVQSTLHGANKVNFIQPHRKFLKQFVFTWYKNAKLKKPRIIFVFSDIIITANAKWKFKDMLPMEKIQVQRNPFDKTQFILKSPIMKHGKNEYKWDNIKDIDEFERLIKEWSDRKVEVVKIKKWKGLDDSDEDDEEEEKKHPKPNNQLPKNKPVEKNEKDEDDDEEVP